MLFVEHNKKRKIMTLYELNKKLTVARWNGFTFNQILKLTIKIYSNLSHKYTLLFKTPYSNNGPKIFSK